MIDNIKKDTAAMDDLKDIEIVDLRHRPDLAQQVIEQNFDVWHEFTDIDRETMAELFSLDSPNGSLPATLIARVGDKYAGCVSLREKTMGMATHPEAYLEDRSPWLSNMWVAEWARGRQLATRLSRALEDTARELGFVRVYSSTLHPDSLYHKMGYEDIEKKPFKGDTIYLIKRDLEKGRDRTSRLLEGQRFPGHSCSILDWHERPCYVQPGPPLQTPILEAGRRATLPDLKRKRRLILSSQKIIIMEIIN